MALFEGEDLISVTTPDGRIMQLPRSAVPASLMPQQDPIPAPLQISPPPISSEIAGAPDATQPDQGPASVTGGALPPTDVSQLPTLATTAPPDVMLGTVDINRVRAQQAAQAQQQRAIAAYNTTPIGQQKNAEAAGNAADAADAAVKIKQVDYDAAGQELIAHATEARNQQIDALMAQRAKIAQANADAEAKQVASLSSIRQQIASTKIDRTADHPVLMALAIAVAGFGSTLKGESTNPALDVVDKAIKAKVDGQMADLDQLGKVYGMTKDQLDAIKAAGASKLALSNILIAAETDKAVRQIQAITTNTDSQKMKLAGADIAAQLQQKAATRQTEAVHWGLDFQQKQDAAKSENNRFYAGQAQARNFHVDEELDKKATLAFEASKADREANSRLAEREDKATQEALKENSTRGLRNLVTNLPLLTPKGDAAMAQADKLDAAATKLENQGDLANGLNDQSRVQMLQAAAQSKHAQANKLRDDATLNQQIKHRDPALAGKLSDEYSAVQDLGNDMSKVTALYDGPNGGKAYVSKSPEQQAISSMYAQMLVKLKDVQGLSRLSKPDIALFGQELGIDPTSEAWTAGNLSSIIGEKLGEDPQGFRKVMEETLDNAEGSVFNKMRVNAGYGGTKGDLFSHHTAPPEAKPVADFMKEKTPSEQAAAVPSNIGTKIYDKTFGILGQSHDEVRQDAADSGSPTGQGFTKAQEADLGALIASYNSGTPAGKRAGEQLVATVANSAADRPSLAIATLRNLREHAGDLYTRARATVPEGSAVDQQMSYEENTRISLAPGTVSTNQLIQQIRATGYTDRAGIAELARRATTKKDKDAASALLEVVKNAPPPPTTPLGMAGFREPQ